MLTAVLKSLYGCQAPPEHNLGILLLHAGLNYYVHGYVVVLQAPENDIGKNSFNYFQIKSAFVMSFTTLTNPKTVLSLGPNRSSLGTIIMPDPVLLERKGGSNGEITFNSLLPGVGKPLQTHFGDPQEIMCNWQSDYEEESFPCGNGSTQSSGKTRKAFSREKSASKKKTKETGESERHEESGPKKEKSGKKNRWRHN